jgi:alpha-amylase
MKNIFRRAASLAILLSALTPIAQAATKDEWRSRSIYRLLTDRFAPASDNAPCDVQQGQYCGGSFKTIMSKLDYIQNDLGFDAIWIS